MKGFTFTPVTRMLWRNDMIALINMNTGEWARAPRHLLETLMAGLPEPHESSGETTLFEEAGRYDVEAKGDTGAEGAAAVTISPGSPEAFAAELVEMGLLAPRREAGVQPCVLDEDEGKEALRKVYFNVTEGCNLGCPTCYLNAGEHRSRPPDLSTGEAMDLLERVAWHADPRFFVISGGEPLMREDIDMLIRHAVKLFKCVNLLTNGCLINIERAQKIANSGVTCVQVSVEGSSREIHDAVRGCGSFDSALRGIENLLAAGMKNIEIVPTLTKHNVEDLPALAVLAEKLGVRFHLSLFMPVGRGFDRVEEFFPSSDALRGLAQSFSAASGSLPNSIPGRNVLDLLPRESCGAGKKVISIGPRGEVYPCALLHHPSLGFGNLFELPLSRILERMDGLIPSVDDMPECANCDVRYFCGGGCRACSFAQFGHFLAKDPYCEFYRHLFGAYLWN